MAKGFIFGMNSSVNAGLIIEQRPNPTVPERRKTVHRVAGRSDDVYEDEGCYNNIEISYKVGCSSIDEHLSAIKALLSPVGYTQLMDSYMGNYYRRAYLLNPVKFEEELVNFGHATLTFSADPYLYDLPGENPSTTISSSGTNLRNPNSNTASLPLIFATGTAGNTITLHISSRSYAFKIPASGEIAIDSLNEIAYSNNQNACNCLDFDEFPYLDAKSSISCSYTGTATIQIFPRWRKL